jgi:hypothetical protein
MGGASLGSAFADRIGRRPRLIYGECSSSSIEADNIGTAWITLTILAAFALTHVFGKGGSKYVVDGSPGASAGSKSNDTPRFRH